MGVQYWYDIRRWKIAHYKDGTHIQILMFDLVVGNADVANPVDDENVVRIKAPEAIAGRIAGRNAARSPRRVAATASALIVGLALVSGVTVIVASAQQSIEDLVDSAFGAELVVSTPTGQPFDTSIGDDIQQVGGVK